jgi:hypothetical protein
MQPMGALQPDLPSPTAIPLDYCLCILDLKDAFFLPFLSIQKTKKNLLPLYYHLILGPWVLISLDSTAPRHG